MLFVREREKGKVATRPTKRDTTVGFSSVCSTSLCDAMCPCQSNKSHRSKNRIKFSGNVFLGSDLRHCCDWFIYLNVVFFLSFFREAIDKRKQWYVTYKGNWSVVMLLHWWNKVFLLFGRAAVDVPFVTTNGSFCSGVLFPWKKKKINKKRVLESLYVPAKRAKMTQFVLFSPDFIYFHSIQICFYLQQSSCSSRPRQFPYSRGNNCVVLFLLRSYCNTVHKKWVNGRLYYTGFFKPDRYRLD